MTGFHLACAPYSAIQLERWVLTRSNDFLASRKTVIWNSRSQIYGRTDSDKKEAALDLACLANAGGGLIVFGVDEDGEGVAKALRPDNSEGDFLLWLDQIAASRISPLLSFSTLRVDAGGGSLYMASVPPSMRRPHSVASGDSLRFPDSSGSAPPLLDRERDR